MGAASRTPGSPTSLVSADAADPDDRRAYKLEGAPVLATSAPVAADAGRATRCHRWLHVEVKVTAGTSVDVKLFVRRTGMADDWSLETRFGTAGTWNVTTAAGLSSTLIELDGVDRVALQFSTINGGVTNIDAWLGTCGDVDGR